MAEAGGLASVIAIEMTLYPAVSGYRVGIMRLISLFGMREISICGGGYSRRGQHGQDWWKADIRLVRLKARSIDCSSW